MVFSYNEVIVVLAMMMMLNTVLHGVCGREYGIPVVHYINSVAMLFFQLMAVGFWFRISNARTDGKCDKEDIDIYGDESPWVCVTDGPALMIFEILVMVFTVALFWVVYCTRGKGEEQSQGTQELQGFGPAMPDVRD
jgi:hypothetical protein